MLAPLTPAPRPVLESPLSTAVALTHPHASAKHPTDQPMLHFSGSHSLSQNAPSLSNTLWNFVLDILKPPRKLTANEQILFERMQEDPLSLNRVQSFLKYKNFPSDGCNISLNARDKNRETLLHHAVLSGNPPIVEYLLERMNIEAINAQNKKGETALHLAAINGIDPIIALLLQVMNDEAINAPNKQNKTALDVALIRGNMETAKRIAKSVYARNLSQLTEPEQALFLKEKLLPYSINL